MTMQNPNPEQAIQAALRHYHAGEFAHAERICREILSTNPTSVDALHVLGFTLSAMQGHEQAIGFYRQALALRPRNCDIWNNLGAALAAVGKRDESIAAYRQALEIDPNYIDALINLGAALTSGHEYDAAIDVYRRALQIDPEQASAHNNLGTTLVAMRQFDEGIAAYHKAIELKPDFADAYSNLGAAYAELNRQEEAAAAYHTAIRLDPLHAPARNNLGNYYLSVGSVEEAIDSFREAIRLRNDFVDALCNLGLALLENQQYDEAIAPYELAHRIAPDASEVNWNLACYLLLRGEFERGWIQYEWRWRTRANATPRINYPKPNWIGEDPAGRTILLYTEQGFGDSIQFVRYATAVARRGANVIVRCRPELARLFEGVAGVSGIFTDDNLPEYDLYCPLMTLPLIFATRLATIPADVPYLEVNEPLLEKWREQIDASDDRLKVGLVWAGGATTKSDRKRSLTLAQFSPLAQIAGIAFYSLQKGDAASAQAANPPPGMTLIDHTAELTDFAETAAMICHLDLVIAVDTAVAHLAGALGKPVWLMIPTNPDWRWMLDRDDSPWYPTLRLFRQTRRGNWDDVIEHIAGALAGLTPSGTGFQPVLSPTTNAPAPNAPRRLSATDALTIAWQHHLAGQYSEAAGIYRQIIAQQPTHSDAHHLLGLSALAAGRPQLAAHWFAKAVALAPAIPDYHHNLALALAACGNFPAAIDAYQNVIRLKPDFPDVHYNLGNAYLKSKRHAEAADAYRHALRFRPDHGDAHLNLGQALAHLLQHAEAVDKFRRAIELNPQQAEAHMNLGLALLETGQTEAALAAAKQAVALDPQSGDAHSLLAVIFLLLGDFPAGWPEYEWRWRQSDAPPPRQFPQPRWDGGDLNGRTILLHAEQGFGDTLQFIRYAPLVARRGGRVIVQCPPALSRLLSAVPGIAEIAPPQTTPAFDVHCPMLSLPLAFATRLHSVPARVPYLQADRLDVEAWRKRLGIQGDDITARAPIASGAQDPQTTAKSPVFSDAPIQHSHARAAPPSDAAGVFTATTDASATRIRPASRKSPLRIGLAWAGGPLYRHDRKRSIQLSQFSPLATIPNTNFYSLQKGPAAAQAAEATAAISLLDHTADLHDFADTAAFMEHLDLIISVDTAVAHLAGALGKRTWLLLPCVPDWRWMLDRPDTPWYPTMKLFRQPTPGDWQPVIHRIAEALRRL
ncbi:MAG TPA: tetratricopeptide repeat protein [Tepidisphaeraceae bacterium]|jgi:tetratricopeptide (TPR) repeat protein/ADP-heptose:LPS heptosyltransferase|nr:tetratricopeptide repeat protein [Tepidisphaeraceae bacterium]